MDGDTDLPKVLTLQQAADILQVTPRTVAKEITAGRLQAFKMRHLWRIRADALDEYMTQSSSQTAYMGATQVGQRIERTRETAWRLMSSGKIESVRRGAYWLATPEAVDRYLAGRRGHDDPDDPTPP